MGNYVNNYYYGIKAHSGLSLTGAIIAYGVNASSKDELEERTKSCCLVNKSVVRCVLDGVESYDKISDELWAALNTIAHNTVVYIQNIGLSTYYGELEAKETVDYIADCKQKAVQSANEKQLVKNSTYWATHISEKEKLEAKKSDAESKRSELIAEMERAPEQEQIRNLQSQINDLTYKLNVLGMNPLDAFMNRKERNSLQAQINNLSEILRPIESAVSERNAKLQLQIDEQSTIIAEVDAELSKNR